MAGRSFLSAYVLLGVLNVISLVTGNTDGAALTKPLLMPLLACWLIVEARRIWTPPLRWLFAALVFAWFGDLLLMGASDLAFALGIGAFLVTQILLVAAFTSVRGIRFRRSIIQFSAEPARGLVEQKRLLLLAFAAYYVVFLTILWPTSGALRIPVAVYGIAILAMAASALNLVGRVPSKAAWVTFTGAGLFVISDSLIALEAFGPLEASSLHSALVMLTYVAAQGLIAVGLVTGVRDVEAVRATAA